MNIENTQFQSAIVRLREGFVETLCDHLDRLTKVAHEISSEEVDLATGFGRVSEIAHRIHGVAKTLTYERLGLVAAEAEAAADAILAATEVPLDQVDAALDNLIDLIEEISAICAPPQA